MPGTILSSRPRRRAPLQSVGPGERVIDGRVYYSAVWLTAAFEAEAVEIEPAKGDDKPEGGEDGRDGEVHARGER